MNDIQHFAKLIKEIKFAMMTTLSLENSILNSRPMTLQPTEFDGNLWFFADRFSKLAEDIEANPQVNLAFSNPKDNSYVSASGTAEIVKDQAKEKELWNPMYKAWFPEGLEDPKLGLIKVKVETADYWESPSSPIIHMVGFAKAILTGEKLESGTLGKRGHLNIN